MLEKGQWYKNKELPTYYKILEVFPETCKVFELSLIEGLINPSEGFGEVLKSFMYLQTRTTLMIEEDKDKGTVNFCFLSIAKNVLALTELGEGKRFKIVTEVRVEKERKALGETALRFFRNGKHAGYKHQSKCWKFWIPRKYRKMWLKGWRMGNRGCDCANPDPDYGEHDGVWHYSNDCPIHGEHYDPETQETFVETPTLQR